LTIRGSEPTLLSQGNPGEEVGGLPLKGKFLELLFGVNPQHTLLGHFWGSSFLPKNPLLGNPRQKGHSRSGEKALFGIIIFCLKTK
jgi:hypothetical protein